MKLAIDLGGTHLRFGLGTGHEAWTETHAMERPVGLRPQDLVSLIQQRLAAWNVNPDAVSGIGVSAAALVNASGLILRAENLGWADVPLATELEAVFRAPARVETDVFCGAAFEAAAGVARGAKAALYVGVGTGIGHALILDGVVWRGAEGRANGMGHLVLWPRGPHCYCGNRGCLCQVASGRAQSRSIPPEGALDALAQAIGIAMTLLDPELVVLAGGALNQPWFDLDELIARLPRFTYPGLSRPTILRSAIADANLRGAALLLQET